MTPAPGFEAVADDIIQREFAVVCARQRGPAWKGDLAEQFRGLLDRYLAGLGDPERKFGDLIGLCQTVAFANRTALEDKA